ncbi:MAG: TAXI family TRAP transporter solute-binding subunit [Burkholderiaceae bacterium]
MRITHLMAAVATAATLAAPSAQAQLRSITIGTNPSGSAFYLIGGGLAKLYQEKLKIRSTAQPYAGSSVYLPLINSGEVTLGLASTVDSGLAYKGQAGFNDKNAKLRTLGQVWIIPYAFITRADSGIKTAEDLKGKRIMGDMPTSQALTLINQAIVESGGLSISDVEFMRSGGLMDGIAAVVEGRADVAPAATSMPALAKSNASVPGGLRVIANGSQGSDEFFSQRIGGVGTSVAKPNDKRPYIVGDTPVVSYATMVVTNVGMSEDDAYKLTKTMHENWAQLQKDYGPMRSVAANEVPLAKPSVPYHPGAIRYYKEAGLWSDAHAAAQAAFK